MGGLYYQNEAKDIVDYQLFQIAGCEEWFRGPQFDLIPGEYLSFIGAAQVFGTFVRYPFTHILAERLPRQVLNMGIGGAGPGRFLQDQAIIDKINGGRACVIQIMSGRSAESSEYETLDGTSALRKRGSSGDYILAEAVWRRLAETRSEQDVRRLISETQEDWLASMIQLCKVIRVPKVLCWISMRRPEDYPETLKDEFRATMETFPHFITRAMLDRLIPHAAAYVESVSKRGMPQLLSNKTTGLPLSVSRGSQSFAWQSGYPSPEMHEDTANALFPTLRHILPKPWETKEA